MHQYELTDPVYHEQNHKLHNFTATFQIQKFKNYVVMLKTVVWRHFLDFLNFFYVVILLKLLYENYFIFEGVSIETLKY
mgnify:CR=1 FL=1